MDIYVSLPPKKPLPPSLPLPPISPPEAKKVCKKFCQNAEPPSSFPLPILYPFPAALLSFRSFDGLGQQQQTGKQTVATQTPHLPAPCFLLPQTERTKRTDGRTDEQEDRKNNTSCWDENDGGPQKPEARREAPPSDTFRCRGTDECERPTAISGLMKEGVSGSGWDWIRIRKRLRLRLR